MAELPSNVTAFQDNWRFCDNCFALWWNGASTNGFCPAPNAPNKQHFGRGSWNFILPANPQQTIPTPS
ncbi:hypothetical protein ABT104_30010 [Streptomyces mobaraensis]|uniref:hypothetical protein n=1 Tax=Streptomyces mobaraensis TaxID=35621 RepID=UPI0033315655